MPFEEDILKAKENLKNALGERFNFYMQNMKKWFRGKLTKQEFDVEARNIVTEDCIHLHNEFLLCIIRKCHNFETNYSQDLIHDNTSNDYLISSNSNVKPNKPEQKFKRSRLDSNKSRQNSNKVYQKFLPVDAAKYIPAAHIYDEHQSIKNLEFCTRERTLPYVKMVHGRLLITLLDLNIECVDLNCVFLIVEATMHLLKNILTKLVNEKTKRNLNNKSLEFFGKNFYYSKEFDSIKNNIDYCEMDLSYEKEDTDNTDEELKQDKKDLKILACQPRVFSKHVIDLFELKELLQSHRYLIPSHSIYTMNMERIICNLDHETNEELNDATNVDND